MTVLVIGSGGMLGYTTYQYLRRQGHQVTGITRTKRYSGMIRMDVTEEAVIAAFLEETPFDAIINCAALLMKPCEERKTDAVKLNAWFPHFLEKFCRATQTYLVQVSTDAVFSGKTGGYQENSPCDPDSFYGKSKLLGEVSENNALTVRSAFWGPDINSDGAGLFQWFMRQDGPVKGYTRALFNGVSNLEFAKFADTAIQNRWTGIYHLCAADVSSKYQFLQIQKHTFQKETEITPADSVVLDRSLLCTRRDVRYPQRTFEEMMFELREWTA